MDWIPVDTENPDVVMDAANICHNKIGGAAAVDLFRLVRLAEAWQEQHGPSTFLVVADESLGRVHLPDHQQRHYRSLVNTGGILETTYADPVILEHAARADAVVLSHDGFRDHRREHPWLQQVGRVYGWVAEGRAITFEDRDLGQLLPADVSRYAEARDAHPNVGAEPWFCHVCGWGPPVDDPTCGGCGRQRVAIDPVEGAIGIVVEEPDGKTVRFVLGPDETIELGRSTPGLGTDELGQVADMISRRHLAVHHNGLGIVVKDLESTNGTELYKWYPGGKDGDAGYEERGDLPSDEWTSFGPNDLALIADGVAVRISGRRDPWGVWLSSM